VKWISFVGVEKTKQKKQKMKEPTKKG